MDDGPEVTRFLCILERERKNSESILSFLINKILLKPRDSSIERYIIDTNNARVYERKDIYIYIDIYTHIHTETYMYIEYKF